MEGPNNLPTTGALNPENRPPESHFYDDVAAKAGHEVASTMEAAYQRAEAALSEKRINMDDFAAPRGVYDPAVVERDKGVVAGLKEIFESKMQTIPNMREAKHAATVFEFLISEQASERKWFGGNTRIIPTSEYDDFAGGVDGVLHVKDASQNSFLALGVDVTFSAQGLEHKMHTIRQQINDGEMARVKYFQLPDGNFKGELKNVPRIVLAADITTVVQMTEQWMEGLDKAFDNHWLRFQLLESIIQQCETYGKFADKKGQAKIAEEYKKMHAKFSSILSLQLKFKKDPGDRDRAAHQMRPVLQNF